jgi:hypothetical protein
LIKPRATGGGRGGAVVSANAVSDMPVAMQTRRRIAATVITTRWPLREFVMHPLPRSCY